MRVVRYSVLAASQMMREARRFGVVTAALGVAVASAVTACPSPLDAQVPSGSVEGRVIDSVSGTPLSGATVLVPGSLWRTTTNDRGVFRLRGVVPGHYTVRVAIIGFESASVPVRVRADS